MEKHANSTHTVSQSEWVLTCSLYVLTTVLDIILILMYFLSHGAFSSIMWMFWRRTADLTTAGKPPAGLLVIVFFTSNTTAVITVEVNFGDSESRYICLWMTHAGQCKCWFSNISLIFKLTWQFKMCVLAVILQLCAASHANRWHGLRVLCF